MTLIYSENNKNAQKIDASSFDSEYKIQEYIYENPNVIPIYDIDENTQLFIAAREFQTKSGRIDGLAFDESGNIYIIETKLYKNPDKRTVVAQAMDYGASLWYNSPDFAEFVSQISSHTQKQFGMDFKTKYENFFDLDDSDKNFANIQENLNSGNIKFVILMDKIHPQLKNLLSYINRNSGFDIYAVELKYYKHKNFEIILPKLFGAEIKKDVISTRISQKTSYKNIDETTFTEAIRKNTSLSKIGSEILFELKNIYEDFAKKFNGEINYFISSNDSAGMTLENSQKQQLILLSANQGVWFYQKDKTGEIAEFNARVLERLIAENLLEKNSKNLSATRWSVKSAFLNSNNKDIQNQLQEFAKISAEEAEKIL